MRRSSAWKNRFANGLAAMRKTNLGAGPSRPGRHCMFSLPLLSILDTSVTNRMSRRATACVSSSCSAMLRMVKPVALIEANLLGQMRTGATSGVATKYMARPDAAVVGCFGTGFQARSQLKAVCRVRRIERIDVYSRNDERRRSFAHEMAEYCGVPTLAVHNPEQAAAEKDIVICVTNSKAPLFDGHVLDEGTHLNVVGSNYLTRAEIDVTTIRRADHIVCDSRDACQLEAGDFVPALEDGSLDWSRVHELSDVVVGRETGRAHAEDITVFKSVGLGLEDLAVAVRVFERAKAEDVGRPLPF